MLNKKIITVIITAVLALSVGIGGTVIYFNANGDRDEKEKDDASQTSDKADVDINNIIPGVVIDDLGEEVPPFVIPNEDSHLSLRLEKISIPLVFKEVSFLY